VLAASIISFTDVSEVLAVSIISEIGLMMEAARTFETSINLYQTTRRNNPEDSHLHIDCLLVNEVHLLRCI
jgi:hypothetical protein